jgi:hypothetical protein
MQALAAEFSGWCRKIPLLYVQKGFKTVGFDLCTVKTGISGNIRRIETRRVNKMSAWGEASGTPGERQKSTTL